MRFLNLKPESFGLDISDLSLKAVKLKKKRSGLALASFGETDLKEGLIEGGQVRDKKVLARSIKSFISKIKGDKLKTNYVAVSLPEEKAFLQVIQMPLMPEEDLKSAVIYEAENHIPLSVDEVYLDSQVISPVVNSLDHFDVLITAMPKSVVDPYMAALKKAGLIPTALEIESLATVRALVKNEISPFPLLLLDLGATRTGFTIFSGYAPRFTTSIQVSSWQLTKSLARNLEVNLEKAEKLKFKYGLQMDQKGEAREAFNALVPALTDLTEQIKKYLNYYQAHTRHEHLSNEREGVRKVVLSGGGANLRGLPEFLASELKIPVELGNPWANILPKPLKEVPELSYQESLSYTTAIGLALRDIKYSK